MSGGTISTKAIFKNRVCSGFTYPKIFEQPNKRSYDLVYVFDLSKFVKFDFIESNILSIIIILLLAPTIIDENEEIFIDIIINTKENVKIIEYNLECNLLKNDLRLNNIINEIRYNIHDSCNPGTCLLTAYKLLLQRKESSKKIFLITDNNIQNKDEILLTLKLIETFIYEDIDFYAIEVGLYPYGLDKLYPKCIYSKSINNIDKCFSMYFNNLLNLNQERIELNDIVVKNIYDFSGFFGDPIDKELQKAIESEQTNIDEFIFNVDIFKLKKEYATPESINPEVEPYEDGVFQFFAKQYKILIVILYLSDKDDKNIVNDDNITEEKFIENFGQLFEEKNLQYTIVYNYLDAINELTKEGDCEYIETLIFCSDGSGNTPKGGKPIYYSNDKNNITIGRKVTKKDNEIEIIPFLKTIAEYNQKGGALLLFCDNFPFVLEANLLLEKYLEFEKYEEKDVNFTMQGNYIRNKDTQEIICRMNDNDIKKSGKFINGDYIESPGNSTRFFPTVGVLKFFEGITLSYAEKKDKNKEIELFKPIAYLSDKNNERPFILYYDPKINEDKNKISRGPIVVHGGLTSAFYEFNKNEK